MTGATVDLVAGLFLVAVLYVLVRPQSKGVDLIQAFTKAMTAIVAQATDLAASPSSNSGGGGADGQF